MRISPEIQSIFVIAVIIIACISIAYSAFGGASQGVPMLTSLKQSNGMWMIGALIVAALLIGVIGAYCPSTLPLAQVSHPLLKSNGTNEVMSEHFAVQHDMNDDVNILPNFTETSNNTHAIALPFALVNGNIKNPLNQKYVLRQLPKTVAAETTHSCRLKFSEFEPGSTYTLRVWIRMDTDMKDIVEKGQLCSFDLRYTTSGYDENYKRLNNDQGLSIVDSIDMNEHVWYLLEKTTPIKIPQNASHIEWYVGTLSNNDIQLPSPVHWCGFHASIYLEGAVSLPVKNGLTSMHSAFEQQSSLNTLGEWVDLSRSGIDAKLSHSDSTFTITEDGGLSFTGPLTGTSSFMLSNKHHQGHEKQDNIGAFTISFVYRNNKTSDTVGVQRLLRVRGEHLDHDSLANPPNYMLDIHIDHDSDELQISQQHYTDNRWVPVTFRVKLHEDVAVYTIVHDGSKNIRLYSNSTERAKQDDWFDRSYRVHCPTHSLIWNEDGKTMATLYATLTYNIALTHKQIQKLSKYLMRQYNTVGERQDTVVYGQKNQLTNNHAMEMNELRAQMKSLQKKLYFAENTSAFSPEPNFYESNDQFGGSYDAYGTPTDHTSLQRYMGRIQSIQEQLRKLREQEVMLHGKMASEPQSSRPLTKGMRVVIIKDNMEAIVSTDEYHEQNIPYVTVDYVDGSTYNKKVKRSEVRLNEEYSTTKQCNRNTPCGSGQFCNYDRLDIPNQGMCESCDSITSCDRSFLVDTKSSCESQCPLKKGPMVSEQEVLCDAKTPCEQNAFCNYVHGDYGYCESCDIVADELCDSEGMTKEAKRQCRKRCLAKEQKPYLYRSELTDAEYNQLSHEKKKNVLHDCIWNRTVRKFKPLDTEPND